MFFLEKLKFFEKTLALTRVELGQAKNQDDGTPVIQVSFETNKLMAFTDKDGNIAGGDGTPQVSQIRPSDPRTETLYFSRMKYINVIMNGLLFVI